MENKNNELLENLAEKNAENEMNKANEQLKGIVKDAYMKGFKDASTLFYIKSRHEDIEIKK